MFHSCFHVQRTAEPPLEPQNSNETEKYDCDLCICGGWSSETEVDIHKRLVHRREINKRMRSRRHVCWNCTKSFPENKDVIEHIKYNHLYSSKTARRVEREIFICDSCNQIFFNKSVLEIHIMVRHTRQENNLMTNCPKCLKRKHYRKIYEHLSQCHAFYSLSLCKICLIKQKNTKALLTHINTHKKYLHCNICGHVSIRERDFNMHLDQYERIQKRFDVKNYKDYFLYPSNKVHWSTQRTKAGLNGISIFNNLYICILCRQFCTNHSEMQEHILRDHSSKTLVDEGPVKKKCSCGEEFSTMILLKHHIFKSKQSYKVPDQTVKEEASDDKPENADPDKKDIALFETSEEKTITT